MNDKPPSQIQQIIAVMVNAGGTIARTKLLASLEVEPSNVSTLVSFMKTKGVVVTVEGAGETTYKIVDTEWCKEKLKGLNGIAKRTPPTTTKAETNDDPRTPSPFVIARTPKEIDQLCREHIAATGGVLDTSGMGRPAVEPKPAPIPEKSASVIGEKNLTGSNEPVSAPAKKEVAPMPKGGVIEQSSRRLRIDSLDFGIDQSGELAICGDKEVLCLAPHVWVPLAKMLAALLPLYNCGDMGA